MFGWDPKAARVTWTVAVMVVFAWALWSARGILTIALVAVFFAYALNPIVGLVERFVLGPKARAWALGSVYLVLVAILITGATLVISQAMDGAALLSQKIPGWIENRERLLDIKLPAALEPYREQAVGILRAKAGTAAQQAAAFLQTAGTQALGLVGNLILVLLVPILSFLMMRDAKQFRVWVLEAVPADSRTTFQTVLGEVHGLIAGYMRALSTMALITGATYWIALSIIGTPYSHLLAVLAGLCEFVPVLGPLVAASAVVLTAILTGSPLAAVVIFMVVYRIILDYVILPWQMKETVNIHPMVTLIGALAGEQVGGVLGLFLSVPVLATLNVLLQVLKRRGLVDLRVSRSELG
jgi:predicted PurR-regulated permease PerM